MEELLALFDEDEEMGMAVRLSGGAVPYGGPAQRDGEDGPEWTGRVPVRGEESVAGLYARVNAGRLRAQSPETGRLVVQTVEQGSGTRGSALADARTLDRVFRRDARRYDGGLSLL